MTRKKLINRDELLKYKVGVRFDEKTYNKLKSQVQQSNASTVGELVRKIVTNEKVTFFIKDISMEEPTAALIKMRKEDQCNRSKYKSVDRDMSHNRFS